VIKTENLTILFVDIAGFTATTSRQSRAENARLLQNFGSTLLPLIKNFKGRLIKTIGDALLITFRSPTDGMLCSMALQDAMHGYNLSAPEGEKIHIRVAANLGEVRVTKNDIFGEPVNVASRIEGVAPADEIYLSEAVYMAMNKAEVPAVEVGSKELAGVPHPVRLYNIPRFSTHRLVSEYADNEEQGSELLYPYGGMHYQTRSGALSSLLHFYDNRKVANFFISALTVSVIAVAVVVGYQFLIKPSLERPAGIQTTTNERQVTAVETPGIQQQNKTEEPVSIKPGGSEATAPDTGRAITETVSEERVKKPVKIITKSPIKTTTDTAKVTSPVSIEVSSTETEQVEKQHIAETGPTKTAPVARQQTVETGSAKTAPVARQQTAGNGLIKTAPVTGQQTVETGSAKTAPVAGQQNIETGSAKTAPVARQQTAGTGSTKNEPVTGQKLIASKDSSTRTPAPNTVSTTVEEPITEAIAPEITETETAEGEKDAEDIISAPITYATKEDTTKWNVTSAKQAFKETKISKAEYTRIMSKLKTEYDKKIRQLKLDLNRNRITRAEYDEAVRKAKLEYSGG
jgi:class 3 adenylate cyclase